MAATDIYLQKICYQSNHRVVGTRKELYINNPIQGQLGLYGVDTFRASLVLALIVQGVWNNINKEQHRTSLTIRTS